MNGLLALLNRQLYGQDTGGFAGSSPYPDFDQEERERLQERKDAYGAGPITSPTSLEMAFHFCRGRVVIGNHPFLSPERSPLPPSATSRR